MTAIAELFLVLVITLIVIGVVFKSGVKIQINDKEYKFKMELDTQKEQK